MSGNAKYFKVIFFVFLFLVFSIHSTIGQTPIGPKPLIDRIQPEAGAADSIVEINGKNFSPDYSVWLGSVKVEVISISAEKIVVRVPPNASSGRFVLKGKYIVESPSIFTVVERKPLPQISGFQPVSGPPGTLVKITGANFSTQIFENTVLLGNIQVVVKEATPKELVVVIPQNAIDGKFTVNVLGSGSATSNSEFKVAQILRISDFSPRFGPPGTAVTIYGSGFGNDKKLLNVSMAGKNLKVLNLNNDSLVVEIPKGAISAPIIVTYQNQYKASTQGSFEIKVPPVINSFEPQEGFPGTIVTIKGSNFGSSELKTRVKLGTQPIKILSIADSKIQVQIPPDSQTDILSVEVADVGEAKSSKPFSVWSPLSIMSFEPGKGEEGTIVKITGQGFLMDVKTVSVFLVSQTEKIPGASQSGEPISSKSKPLNIVGITPTEILVKIPAGASSGKFLVEVKGRGKVMSSESFLVVKAPIIKQFVPQTGQIGEMVTITGKNFGFSVDNIRVWIGPPESKQFCIVQQITDEKLICQIQPGTISGPITVAVKDMGETISSLNFEIQEPLQISGFSPSSGLPGTMVTIKGTGFSPVLQNNSVKLGKVKLKLISSDSHSIVVQIPDTMKTGGNFIVSVKGKAGSAISSSSFNLIIPVKIFQITPKAGPVGTTVKISGQGFGTNLQMIQVMLLGFYCPIVSLTPEELQVLIPPGLIPGVSEGKFQVIVNPGGISESPVSFKVTQHLPKTKAIPKK